MVIVINRPFCYLKLINNLCLDELPDDGRVKETTNMKINCLLLNDVFFIINMYCRY